MSDPGRSDEVDEASGTWWRRRLPRWHREDDRAGALARRRRGTARARVARRVLGATVAVLVVVALVAAGIGVHTVRQSFPQTSGELRLAGLSSQVTVVRDDKGIPQIYASTAADLFEAQGFVTAQDRFFQMDLRRHITAGRLSEMVGSTAVTTDRVVRALGWRRTAEREMGTLDPTTQSYLRAYSAGVNAYIASRGSPARMSLEYTVLGQQYPGYRVEPWTPVDSLSWLGAIAWDLRSDYDSELERARLAGSMSMAHIAVLFPPYPRKTNLPILSARDWRPQSQETGTLASASLPSTLDSKAARLAYASVSRAIQAVPTLLGTGSGIGSNSWVVSGSRTTTRKPLLANDPHLDVGMPGIWYQSGLHCRALSAACPFDVTGFTFAGLPGVVIGHNQRIAWGMTNLGADVSDLYLEQTLGSQYLRDGVYLPLQVSRQTIKVAGGSSRTVTIRSTDHGPLLSDLIPSVRQAGGAAPIAGREHQIRYAVSLQWTGMVPNHTADAIFELDSATTWDQFRSAARSFAVPAQNLVYADTKGDIGYQAPGLIPIRRSAINGAPPGYWPAPGWNSAYDWKGYLPFEQMPHVLNPVEGMVVAANQEVSASKRPFLTSEWDDGYRAQRIRDLLSAGGRISPQQMSQIQTDTANLFAPVLVKALLSISLRHDAFTRDGQRLLRHWNYTSPTSGTQAAAAAYYSAVWANLLRLTFDDELPRDLYADGGSRWFAVVARLLAHPRDPWWDNKGTPGVVESRDEVLRESMVDARLELTRTLGKDASQWQWGRLHQVELTSQVLGGQGVPSLVHTVFNRGPWQLPGFSSVIDANGGDLSYGYAVTSGPSMRMVVDLSDLDASRWVNQTGASGHAYDAHYDDQVQAWADGQTYAWPFSSSAVHTSAKDTLTLRPAS